MKYKVICNLQNKFNEMLLIAVSYVTTLKQWHLNTKRLKISHDFSGWDSQKVLRILLTLLYMQTINQLLILMVEQSLQFDNYSVCCYLEHDSPLFLHHREENDKVLSSFHQPA